MTERRGEQPSGEGNARDDDIARAIPGAWSQPASAFVDESSVVRPDRRLDNSPRGRVVRLLVLAGFAAGTSAFAWGVTVALQGLDEEETVATPKVAGAEGSAEPERAPS